MSITADPRIWRGFGGTVPRQRVLPTGIRTLDAQLGGGWPLAVLTEILVPEPGGFELQLLSQPLARLDDWVMLVAPPLVPYAPGLQAQGVDVTRLLVSWPQRAGNDSSQPRPADISWAVEQSLQAGIGVVAWITGRQRITWSALRRLQLAAAKAEALLVLVRDAHFRGDRSPAAVRVQLTQLPSATTVDVFRNRFGRPARIALPAKSAPIR